MTFYQIVTVGIVVFGVLLMLLLAAAPEKPETEYGKLAPWAPPKPTARERAIQEKKDLDDKIYELALCIHSGHFEFLPADEQDAWQRQLRAMRDYSEILGVRILGNTK